MKKVVKNMFLVTKGGPQNSGLHALIRMGAPLVITLHTSLICAGNGWGCHFAEYGGTCLRVQCAEHVYSNWGLCSVHSAAVQIRLNYGLTSFYSVL